MSEGRNADFRFAVEEPYYSEMLEKINGLERDLVLLTQMAISYIGCCEDSSEIFNMNTILQNLLNEHKSQMKVIECACTSFYMKNA